MLIEHFAINVPDPLSWSAWYAEQLGLRTVRHLPQNNQTHFLTDDAGQVCIEIYCNPPENVPNYKDMHPLQMHLAFASDTPEADRDRLVTAGASVHETLHLDDGSILVMMRDPWGIAFQLCKRGKPLL